AVPAPAPGGEPDALGEEPGQRFGDGRAEILEAWFENEQGMRAETLTSGRPCTFAAQVRFKEQVEDPLFGINVQNGRRDHFPAALNLLGRPRFGVFPPRGVGAMS